MELDAIQSKSISRLISAMEAVAGFARESVQKAASEFGFEWEQDFSNLLDRIYATEESIVNAAKGYGAFAMDSMRRQKRFEKELQYPSKSYAEAAAEVYQNDEYMRIQYLPGLLLSHYLWNHHYRQIEYYKNLFLPWLVMHKITEFAEVGVGTGIYSRIALQQVPQLRGVGFDISLLSLQFSFAHIESFGLSDRYATVNRNVLEQSNHNKYHAVVCVELLEHLEDPVAMLVALKNICADGGRLFVTAALNAANADHIYLYRQPQEVLKHVEQAGLHLEHCFHANAYMHPDKSIPVPSAFAMVLRPRES